MSDKDNKNNNVPLEFPSRNQKIITDPIVDVVKNETFPPKKDFIENITSISQQG
ncbi:MAG: hypothetical protein ACI4HO_05315 [Ruminococcus sp.]